MISSNPLFKFLKDRRVEDAHYTHGSMMAPKGKFRIVGGQSGSLDTFWDLYCSEIYQDDDFIIGLTENNASSHRPILVDIDIKVKYNEEYLLKNSYLYQDQLTLISIYQSILKKIVENCDETKLNCVVLEKPPYVEEKNQEKLIKNGFHLHFPYIFLKTYDIETYLFPRVVEEFNKIKLFQDIPDLLNPRDILDGKACTRSNWLLYGSRKNEYAGRYLVTKVINSEGIEISIDDAFEKYRIYDQEDKPVKFINEIDYYLPQILSIKQRGGDYISYIRPTTTIPAPILKVIPKFDDSEKKVLTDDDITNNLALAKKLVPLLDDSRADKRDEWIEVGWILFNISLGTEEGLELWDIFSQRCPDKYHPDTCRDAWGKMWKGKWSIGSLKYLAKVDSPEEFNKIADDRSEIYIRDSLNGSHNDIAKALYEKYGTEIVCADITNKRWYQFFKDEHIWKKIDAGYTLRIIMSNPNELIAKYKLIIQQECNLLGDDTSPKACQAGRNIDLAKKIIANLKNSTFKQNVLKECMEVFYQENFLSKLDANGYLIGLNNGIYDLKAHLFRSGRPDDYISIKMPVNYKEMNYGDAAVINVMEFLEKVFPDTSIREYFMDTSASIFIGGNANKIVLMWTGDGDNAKSVTQTLFEKMLGDYAVKLPTSLITGKRTQSSAACPELVQAGNGVRWAVLQEPSKKDVINVGVLKELSGNDTFYARGLYVNGGKVNPQFKLIFVCLAADTQVALRNGTSYSIENLKNCSVQSYLTGTDESTISKQTENIYQGWYRCIEIRMADGRKVRCTPNHKFYSNFGWIEARDLKVGETRLKTGVIAVNCDDTFKRLDGIVEIGRYRFDMSEILDKMKAAALFRLLGYSWFLKGNPSPECIDDVFLLTGIKPQIRKFRGQLNLSYPEIDFPDGLFDGINNVLRYNKRWPLFLYRELLSGLLTTNGTFPFVYPTGEVEGFEILDKIPVDFLTKILKKFGIKFKISDNGNVQIVTKKAILRYLQRIGFRYQNTDIHSSDLISYLRFLKFTKKSDCITSIKDFKVLSRLGYLPVVGIKDVGLLPVYDITVEKTNCFLAEGIVTHNCNDPPEFPYDDKAAWNRMRLIPFESTFVDNAPDTYEEQFLQKKFPKDIFFADKIPDMTQAFAWILLDRLKKMKKIFEPEKVKLVTAAYRKKNDVYRMFIEEKIAESPKVSLTIDELYNCFKDWYRSSIPNHNVPVKSDVKDYFQKIWGAYRNSWKGYRIKTIDDEIEQELASGDAYEILPESTVETKSGKPDLAL